MKLAQQLINRLAMTSEPFTATFAHAYIDNNKSTLQFRKAMGNWLAEVEWQQLLFSVAKITNTSIHLTNKVAGRSVSLTLPFSQLTEVKDLKLWTAPTATHP